MNPLAVETKVYRDPVEPAANSHVVRESHPMFVQPDERFLCHIFRVRPVSKDAIRDPQNFRFPLAKYCLRRMSPLRLDPRS